MIYNLEELPLSLRVKVLTTLNKGLRFLIRLIDKTGVLSEDSARQHRRSLQSNTMSQLVSADGSRIDVNCIRNSLKSYVYLITFFLTQNSKLKESKENQTKARRK
jgi:hypothetical protein